MGIHPAVRRVHGWAVAILLMAPISMFAEQTAPNRGGSSGDARWNGWLGCWRPLDRAPRDRDIQVCVVPTSDRAGARMLTFASGQQILEDTILADGSSQTLLEENCKGSSRSTWSRDSTRLFRVTELACEGKALQRTAGISALDGANQWLDVQVVFVDGRENVRTRRYVRSEEPAPAVVADEVHAAESTPSYTKTQISGDDVIEATAAVSPRAVEAWLAEASARVPVNKRTLIAFHDAQVPTNVIDLMVARAYPERFQIRQSRAGGGGSFGSLSVFDDYQWMAPWDLMFDPYAFYYSPFGSYRGFVDPAYLTFGGYVTTSPVQPTAESGTARVVNGSGYTRVEPRPGAVPRSSSGDSGDASSSGGSFGSGSSSSSDSGASASPAGYSSGGGGGGQTAVPR